MNNFFKRSLIFSAVVVITVMLILAWHCYSINNPPVQRQVLTLASLKPGLSLIACSSVRYPEIVPKVPEPWLELHNGGDTRTVNSLADLRGEVSIDGPQSALTFVRLRTSPATYHLCPGDGLIVEIVPENQVAALPTFGIRCSEGTPGVITQTEFIRAGFTEPTVHCIVGQYVVTRWILCWDSKIGPQCEKVRETVAPDGGYTMAVIASKHPPRHTFSDWGFQVYL